MQSVKLFNLFLIFLFSVMVTNFKKYLENIYYIFHHPQKISIPNEFLQSKFKKFIGIGKALWDTEKFKSIQYSANRKFTR